MRSLLFVLLAGCSTGAPTTCDPPGTQVAEPRAAGCIAVDGGKLLLVKNGAGLWSVPGGLIEAGETTELAAVRETLEEAGVIATAGPPVCAVPSTGFVAHACVVFDPSPTQADGSETTEARWMTRDEVSALTPAQLRFPDQRGIYTLVLDAATRAEQRAIQGEVPPRSGVPVLP